MKRNLYANVIIAIVIIVVCYSCKKATLSSPQSSKTGVPILTIVDLANITATTATLNVNITDDGVHLITKRGFCWSAINPKPTVEDSVNIFSGEAGNYRANISFLKTNTNYYVRAYANNTSGIGYSEAKQFQTLTLNDVSSELRVIGNKILNNSNIAIRLTGVNVGSLEYTPKGEYITKGVQAAFDNWNSYVIRLPLNQDYWFGYRGSDPEAYRSIVSSVVHAATIRNRYVILDLHWSGQGDWGQSSGQHKMPDDNSIIFWQSVSSVFGNNPAVLFGLYNEPNSVTWDIWQNGGSVTDGGITYHTPGLQKMIEAVRDVGAKNICIVGGLDWAYDLTGISSHVLVDRNTNGTFTGNGIVYDAHVYPWKNDWDTSVSCISNLYPILIGECGYLDRGGNELYLTWTPKMLDWMDTNKYNWTGWCLNPNNGPTLIMDWNFAPTKEWGAYAKQRLLGYNGF